MAEAALPLGAWRWLAAGEWRAHPLRFLLAALAIAVGVALGFAVHVVNRSAADAFGEAVRSVSGEADLQVRGSTALGFDELLYPRLFHLNAVEDASPVIELRASVGGMRMTLLGLDLLRAINVTPRLAGIPRETAAAGRGGMTDAIFDPDAVYLSRSALQRTGLKVGDRALVRFRNRSHAFRVAGDLPAGEAMAVVDIAAAQWRLDRLGRLNRIDVKLRPGTSTAAAREAIAAELPADARLTDAESEARRGDSLSRAYRVNLDMLALVALLTGGFLIYSAQSLSVMRRFREFALLRTLGLQRRHLRTQLLAEGAALGLVGSAAGLLLGYALANATIRLVGGDLGGRYFGNAVPELCFSPVAAILFLLFGIGTAVAGSYTPARAAERITPADALKNAGDIVDPRQRPRWRMAALLALLGVAAAQLPAMGRLPVFGYVAMALVLAGGVAAMPWLARALLRPLARFDSRLPSFELSLSRLLGAPSQARVALGGIVASTGLMIAMAVMVTSFRTAVDEWLDSFLSADLYIAAASGEPLFGPDLQARLAATPGIRSIAFSKGIPLTLDPELPSVELIIRPVGGPGYTLPLIGEARKGAGIALWVSEPAARLHGLAAGERLDLPIGGRSAPGHVAGIWRDYARQQGAIVIDDRDYAALTGDRVREEAAVTLHRGASAAAVREGLRSRLPPGVNILDPASLRGIALRLFDRSFAITYVLEAIAILIGLAGVAATISAQTIARTKEFGMLRHVGMSPRQIVAMLASEGALLGLIGMAAGIGLGVGLSQILIHVINPQSFNWTMSTRLPWPLLGGVAVALVAAAAGTAVVAGRHALSKNAVRAVSEDW